MSDELTTLLDRFISGADTSLEAANRLELLIEEVDDDDDHLEETVDMLAAYRPGDADWTIPVETLQKRLAATRDYLKRLA